MRRFFPLLPLLAIALASCSPESALVIGPGARGAWEAFIADHPLPPGLLLREAAERAANTLTVSLTRTEAASGTAGHTASETVLRRTISRTPLAPAVALWDPRQDVSLGEAVSGALPLERLSEIHPPRRALSVDGKLPGDPGYPFYEETILSLAGRDRGLAGWLSALPDAAAPDRPVWVAAVGDIMPARGVDAALIARGPEAVFTDTLGILRASDLVLGNLEAPASIRGSPARKGYTFRFRPQALDALKSAGFSYLSLTNNHCLDYGMDAFLDTLENLSARGIATSGAGRDLAGARGAAVLERRGQEFRVFSMGLYPAENNGWDGGKDAAAAAGRPGILWADGDSMEYLRTVGLKESGLRIVMVHGGEEWSRRPVSWFRLLCRQLADMGADVVLGSHPHVLQGLEGYSGSLIAYSLGNFVFPGMDGTEGGEDSMILEMGVWAGKVRYIRARPVRLDGITVRLNKEPGSDAQLLSMSRDLSAP